MTVALRRLADVQDRPRIADQRLNLGITLALILARLPGPAQRRAEQGPSLHLLGQVAGRELGVERVVSGEGRRGERELAKVGVDLAFVLFVKLLPDLVA